MAITRFSVVTLIFFVLSITFVIYPVDIRFRQRRLSINLTTAPILAIAILWAAQCLGPAQIRDGIVGTDGVKPYNILILFFSLAYMAITLDISGALQATAFWVSNKGGTNGRRLYFYFYVMLTLLGILLGNDPVVLSGTVFLVYYTHAVDLEPFPWIMAEFAAANTASMVLVVGNLTNVVVCEGFSINFAALTLYTILVFLACTVVCYLVLAYQFRDERHVPKRMKPIPKFDVRGAIRDPVSAAVGTVLLFSCIVVIMVVSFFKVDVWKITLPFAVAKFLFDLVWDYGRSHKKTGLKTNQEEPNRDFEKRITPAITEPSKGTLLQMDYALASVKRTFPTACTALPRLPFALAPFSFSQFILIEALDHQGWIDVFGHWLARTTRDQIHPTIWLVGVLGIILCNVAGTNIGATILLTKIVRAASLSANTTRAAGIALALTSNIGAVSATFSASLAGLLWRSILKQKQKQIAKEEARLARESGKEDVASFAQRLELSQSAFARWNALPLLVMTVAGLGVVSLEMLVLY
ncbi:Arsenical pump membrane protein [Mycena indigotica]|uniref:Arsenical pump membrane protein n=1 Tax=Mycena indigotica TaxID=2126181 RepID=A0A8H6TEP8_9AGAR|nr:Arsenical pump membrane protein [Mycena indigotica]KAF7316125.1 Arsenical pump membrane protein [Mycena indigotica]